MECADARYRNIEADNARLREELSIAQQQLAEARGLIKRYEDAINAHKEWCDANFFSPSLTELALYRVAAIEAAKGDSE